MRRNAWLAGALAALVATVACGPHDALRVREARDEAPKDMTSTTEPSATTTATTASPTFADDVAFLRAHGHVEVLEGEAGARVAVSPIFQGRVMTSAVADAGPSLGWIHRAFITSGKTGTAFDNYGGEDRFWLGPEGGQMGLFFPPGSAFTFEAWQTPHDVQEGPWAVTARTPSSIALRRSMHVANRAGTAFDLEVTRTVRMLGAADVARRLGVTLPAGIEIVAFESENRVKNTGARAWTREGGLVSAWILAMYNPAEDAHVLVPFRDAPGEIVNDRYFGKVPAERLVVDRASGVLSFACDGKQRGKIGVGPAHARPVLGSYSAAARLLTIVQLDLPAPGARPPAYVNSMWEEQSDPYAGDVVNSYNDGPVAPGRPSLGGFYEIETSSPALALAPGASAVHTHRTFHLTGNPDALEVVARAALAVPSLRLR